MGTLGVSEAGEAWDWRLTDSQPMVLSRSQVLPENSAHSWHTILVREFLFAVAWECAPLLAKSAFLITRQVWCKFSRCCMKTTE